MRAERDAAGKRSRFAGSEPFPEVVKGALAEGVTSTEAAASEPAAAEALLRRLPKLTASVGAVVLSEPAPHDAEDALLLALGSGRQAHVGCDTPTLAPRHGYTAYDAPTMPPASGVRGLIDACRPPVALRGLSFALDDALEAIDAGWDLPSEQ